MRTWVGRQSRGGDKAFTLVEMLIVVVIIGILSTTILPRITGYLAKTRDVRRQVDLRNIVTAIERYRDEHGVLPLKGHTSRNENSRGTFQASAMFPCFTFERTLKDYISAIPRDPSTKNLVKLHKDAVDKYPNYWYGNYHPGSVTMGFCDGKQVKQPSKGAAGQPGQYFYQVFRKGSDKMGAAIVAAKVETPEFANYIRIRTDQHLQGGFLKPNLAKKVPAGYIQEVAHDISDLKLCNSVKKSSEDKYKIKSDETVECSSSGNELYYIIKIE